jgi:hypothetical protein
MLGSLAALFSYHGSVYGAAALIPNVSVPLVIRIADHVQRICVIHENM